MNPPARVTSEGIILGSEIGWVPARTAAFFYGGDWRERCEYADSLMARAGPWMTDREEMQSTAVTTPASPAAWPYRDRTPEEDLDLFRRMRAGEFPPTAKTLRAKTDHSQRT